MLKGVYELIAIAPNTLTQFGNLGFNHSNTYFTGKRPEDTPRLISNSYYLTAVFSIPAIILGIGYMQLSANQKIWENAPQWVGYFALIVIPIAILDMLLESILYGQNRIWVRNVHEMLRVLCGIIFIGIFVVGLHWAVTGAVYVFVLVNITLIAFVLIILFRFHKPVIPRWDPKLAGESWKFARFPWGSNLFGYLVLKVDVWLINALAIGTSTVVLEQVGLYTTAVSAVVTIWIIPQAIHTALLPKIIQKGEAERKKLMPPSIRAVTVLVLLAIILTIIVAKPLLNILFNRPGAPWDFTQAYTPLLLLLPGAFFFALAKIFTADLFSRGKPHFAMWSTAATLVTNIIINLILIPSTYTIGTLPISGMNGAAIASSISYFVLFILLLIIYFRESGEKPGDIFIPKKDDIQIIKEFALKAWEKLGSTNTFNKMDND
jgi:O-antigen/teichoic acid export membrane protein